jgi:N-acylglucosamine 2-epimerase
MNIAASNPDEPDLNLSLLRSQLHSYLFDDYLPFLQSYVVDPTHGGFTCSVRPNGQLVSGEKITWYQGRGLWVYSFLYNHFGHNQEHLRVAMAAHQLIERGRPKVEDELWPKVLNADGTAASTADPEIYGDLFIAEGLAELSRATGNQAYWNDAKKIILKCVRHYDRADYAPRIGETYLGADAPAFPGARIGGVWMVLLRTTTQMLQMRPDAQLEALSGRSIDALMNHHVNARFQLLNELMEHDLSRPGNEYAELVYAGHAIEILWMVLDEAIRRKDEALFDRAAVLFRRHCEVATDDVYGGLFRNLRDVSQNDWTLDKTLFPHQEALIGLLLLVEHRQDPWASRFFAELYSYTTSRFPMRDIGSPLWQVAGDRYVTRDTNMTRVENYHHPRFLMLSLMCVERMLKHPQ